MDQIEELTVLVFFVSTETPFPFWYDAFSEAHPALYFFILEGFVEHRFAERNYPGQGFPCFCAQPDREKAHSRKKKKELFEEFPAADIFFDEVQHISKESLLADRTGSPAHLSFVHFLVVWKLH